MIRVDVVDRFPELSVHLRQVLQDLAPDEWTLPTSCPGWSVHDVAVHLLGVEVGNVSVRRDGWRPDRGPAGDGGMDAWTQVWVDACRRTSPALLVDLLAHAAGEFSSYVATLDLDAMGGPVGWATGTDPAPVWLDVAREYMERCVHQMQIRDATGRPALPSHLVGPVVATGIHALPVALAGVDRPSGTEVVVRAEGDGGGEWTATRGADRWSLSAGAPDAPACVVRTSVLGAVLRMIRDPRAPDLEVIGDAEVGRAVAELKAILG